jgi:hypothetical protein
MTTWRLIRQFAERRTADPPFEQPPSKQANRQQDDGSRLGTTRATAMPMVPLANSYIKAMSPRSLMSKVRSAIGPLGESVVGIDRAEAGNSLVAIARERAPTGHEQAPGRFEKLPQKSTQDTRSWRGLLEARSRALSQIVGFQPRDKQAGPRLARYLHPTVRRNHSFDDIRSPKSPSHQFAGRHRLKTRVVKQSIENSSGARLLTHRGNRALDAKAR